MAATLQEAGGGAGARAAVEAQASGDRDRAGEAQGRRARRIRAVAQAPSRSARAPAAGGRAGRFDARPLHDVDARARQSAARAGEAAAGSGAVGSGREDALELVRLRDLELVVSTIFRRLVRPPAQEGRRVAEAIALQVVVLHFAHALRAQRLP